MGDVEEACEITAAVAPRRMLESIPFPPASSQARRQAAAILEVLAGVRRPGEAAGAGHIVARSIYWSGGPWGLLTPAVGPRGPRLDLSRRISAFERENRRLQRECDRQQALVRAAERSLGLGMPVVKPFAKGKEEPASGGERNIGAHGGRQCGHSRSADLADGGGGLGERSWSAGHGAVRCAGWLSENSGGSPA